MTLTAGPFGWWLAGRALRLAGRSWSSRRSLSEGLVDVREDLLTTNREVEQLINALLLPARSDRGPDANESVDLAEVARLVAVELSPRVPCRPIESFGNEPSRFGFFDSEPSRVG